MIGSGKSILINQYSRVIPAVLQSKKNEGTNQKK